MNDEAISQMKTATQIRMDDKSDSASNDKAGATDNYTDSATDEHNNRTTEDYNGSATEGYNDSASSQRKINDCQQRASLHIVVIIWEAASSYSAATTNVLNPCAL